MIKTKNSQPTDDSPKQLNFEDAVVKGKLYNPITGRELAHVVAKRISAMLTEVNIDADNTKLVAITIERELLRHPSFDSEVKSYPKAIIALTIVICAGHIYNDTSSALARYRISVTVAQFPQEENRGFAHSIDFINSYQPWEREPLSLQAKWNIDDIPPDATRILSDLPVPTPTKTPGSGPSGVATITDELKPADEKQVEAVKKQFGSVSEGSKVSSRPYGDGGKRK